MKLEYHSAMSPHYQYLNHMLPTIPEKKRVKTKPTKTNPTKQYPPCLPITLTLTRTHSNPHTLTPSAAEIKNIVMIAFAYR